MKRFFEILILVGLGGSLAFAQKPRYPYSHGYFSSINDRLIYATAYSGSTVAAQVNAAVSANLGPCVIVITPEMSGTSGDFTGMSLPNSTYEIEDLRGGNTIWGFLSGGVITKSAQPWPAGIRFPDGTVQTTAATGGTGGANTTLSNLTSPTAINDTTLTFAGDAGMTGGSGVYQTLISGGTSTGSSVKINPYVGGGGQILAQNNTAYMDFNSINFRPSTLNQTVVRATGTVATTVFPLSCPTAASTCTVDLSRSNIFQITLTAAVTSVVFNFPVSGVTYTFDWIQDGTGETVSGFPAAWHGITAPGSTASTYSRQDCDWNGSIAICGVANTNIP